MSDERETIDLAYNNRSLDRLTAEVAGLRDDMKELTPILLRCEETMIRVLEQATAMVSENARMIDRLRAIEDRVEETRQ